MADNLKELKGNLDVAIDPNKGIGEILAQQHNDVFTEFINKSGKYTGFPFLAVADPVNGNVPVGHFVWNGNTFNNTNAFVISVSNRTADLNDVGKILDTLNEDSIIHFKDFIGRSVFLLYKSHAVGQSNNHYDISVVGYGENQNYAYQNAEKEICVIEFYANVKAGSSSEPEKITVDGVEYTYRKNSANGTAQAPNQFDIAEFGVRTITEDGNAIVLMQTLSYSAGTPSDLASWIVLSEVEV